MRDHMLARDLRKRRLVELRMRSLDGDVIVDAIFHGGGERTHLAFIGVSELKIAGLEFGAVGYSVQLVEKTRAVKLVPPKRKGLSLSARAVMSVA